MKTIIFYSDINRSFFVNRRDHMRKMIEDMLEDYANHQTNLSSEAARSEIANSIIDLFSGKRKTKNSKQLSLQFGEFDIRNYSEKRQRD